MARLLCFSLLFFLLLSAALPNANGHRDGDDSGDGSSPDLRSRPLILTKVWCLIVVFFATFFGGISPYFLKWNEAFLTLGTQFAGGVFLATAMIHFLPDANETFADLTAKVYPFAFMLACAGFTATMLADCVVTAAVARGASILPKNKSESANAHSILRDASTVGDSILLILALCFHSVFEGIAIGVAETEGDAWKALWTISLHKIFAAVAMGIALLRMIPDRPLLSCVTYASAFAISSPVGIVIGIIIDAMAQGRTADWIYAISMGLACGIFIYVSVNHLLAKGYNAREPIAADTPTNRCMAAVAGIAVIAVVMIWDT